MRPMVVEGDATDHGGTVISASGTYKVNGRRGVLEGDLVSCPIRGHGVTPILSERSTKNNGRAMAIDGDVCGCGARLIGSGSAKVRG
jgi:uncharacterized Zn-binding protein involved in type VI secretion